MIDSPKIISDIRQSSLDKPILAEERVPDQRDGLNKFIMKNHPDQNDHRKLFPIEETGKITTKVPRTVLVDFEKEYKKHKRVVCSLHELRDSYFDAELLFQQLFMGKSIEELGFKPRGKECDKRAVNDPTIPVLR